MLAGEIALGSAAARAINANVQRRAIIGIAGTLNRMVMKIMASPQIKKPDRSARQAHCDHALRHHQRFFGSVILKELGAGAGTRAVILQVGSIPNVLASLRSGTSQLGALSPPPTSKRNAGFAELMDLSKREIFYPYTYITVTTGLVEKNSNLIRPFLAAAAKGFGALKPIRPSPSGESANTCASTTTKCSKILTPYLPTCSNGRPISNGKGLPVSTRFWPRAMPSCSHSKSIRWSRIASCASSRPAVCQKSLSIGSKNYCISSCAAAVTLSSDGRNGFSSQNGRY